MFNQRMVSNMYRHNILLIILEKKRVLSKQKKGARLDINIRQTGCKTFTIYTEPMCEMKVDYTQNVAPFC